jgi:hypothetical protein
MSVRAQHDMPHSFGGMNIDPNAIAAHAAEDAGMVDLGEGATGFHGSGKRDNPLERTVSVSIRASLADLSTSTAKAVWAPNKDQLESIYKQSQFVDLSGDQARNGDLKSVVLHSIAAESVKSSFPFSLGTKITGVEENHFSSIGTPYSMVVMPHSENHVSKKLADENTEVAYAFAQKYPGYNAENLETNGVHAVPQRRFVLVAASHPLVTAIHENASALQMADVTQMPEQLVKISSSLYSTLMPMVKQQVASQIKVCDLSRFAVSVHPSDHASWQSAADHITAEALKPLKEELKRALKRPGFTPEDHEQINAEFQAKIEKKQAEVTHAPMEFHMNLKTTYNFL